MKEYKNGNISLTTAELLTEGPRLLAKGYTQVLVSKTGIRFAPPEHLKPKVEVKGTPKTFADSQAAKFGFTEEQCDTIYKFVVEGKRLGKTSEELVSALTALNPGLKPVEGCGTVDDAVWAAFRVGKARRIAAQAATPKVKVPGTIVLPELSANVTTARETAEAKSEYAFNHTLADTKAREVGFQSYRDLRGKAKKGDKKAAQLREVIGRLARAA